MSFVNLTPHTINIVGENGTITTVEPSGQVARVGTRNILRYTTADGVPVYSQQYGDIADLPYPQPGVFYVVSAMVRLAAPHRLDIASPGDLIRNESGQPVGCRGLIVN